MPISAPGDDPLTVCAPACAGAPSQAGAREGGFTLVELMVAIAIIGVLTATIVLTAPDPRGRLIDEAERFAARTVAARDAAIIDQRSMAVRVTSAGYAFDQESAGAWAPVQAPPFRSTAWDGDVRAELPGGAARVSFDPTGTVSDPASFVLVRDDQRITVRIGADGSVATGR